MKSSSESKTKDEFWNRELGSSSRRLKSSHESKTNDEFWNRELGSSARSLKRSPESKTKDEFWKRELGSSARMLLKNKLDAKTGDRKLNTIRSMLKKEGFFNGNLEKMVLQNIPKEK